MEGRRSAWTSICVFTIVLALALIVNGALGLSGFEDVYRDALVSRYSIDGEYIKGRVESSLDLGKKIYLLDGTVKPLFAQVLSDSPGIDHLYIADTSGKILYTTRSVLSHGTIPFSYSKDEYPPPEANSPYTVKFLDSWFACIPLYSGGEFTGTVFIEFSQKSITNFIYPYANDLVKAGIVMFVVATLVYALLSFLYGQRERREQAITIGLLFASQLAFAVQNYRSYNQALSSIFNANMARIGKSVMGVMENPLSLVSGFDSMTGVNEYLEGRLSGNRQCSGIFVIDENQRVLYQAVGGEAAEVFIDRGDPDISLVDLPESGGKTLQLALRINRPLISSILRDMALDSGTVIIVALIFAFILKNFFIMRQRKDDLLVPAERMTEEQGRTALKLIEISTFVFMFAAYVTLSFIPLYIQDIFNQSGVPFFGLSAKTVESIPISTYMVGIMVSMFITLFGMKGLSVKRRYVVMSAVFIAGSALTVASEDVLTFSVSRLVSGFGFGGVLLSTSSLVILYTDGRTRSAGFGTNAAAFASASIASISVGGVIVNKFGYAAGIVVSIIFASAFLLFSIFCIPERRPAGDAGGENSKNVTVGEFFRVLFSRHILTYIAFVNVPFQLIYWGLFQFLLPLYMSETLSLSQGNIGRILSIFSVVSLMAASVSRIADRMKNDKLLIAIGAAAAGGVMLFFGFSGGGFLLFLAVMVAMGVDNLFIDSIEEVYLESGSVRGVSGENLLQTYKVIEKVLSVFVPTATSLIILKAGFNASLMIIGLYSLAGAALFVLFGKNGRWGKGND